MPKILFVTAQGQQFEVTVQAGRSVMEAAVTNGVPGIRGECGGGLNCATCHVYIDPLWAEHMKPPHGLERAMLGLVEDRRPTSRLSCQIRVSEALDGMRVDLPETQI